MLSLESLPQRQEATENSHRDLDTGGSNFGELIQPQGHWCWQALFWSPPSSLLVLGAYLPTSWSAPVLGSHRPSSQLPGDPGPLPQGCHLPQVPTAPPPPSQLPWDMAPPTSRPTPVPGPLSHAVSHARTWLHPPAAGSLHTRQGLTANWPGDQTHLPAYPQ